MHSAELESLVSMESTGNAEKEPTPLSPAADDHIEAPDGSYSNEYEEGLFIKTLQTANAALLEEEVKKHIAVDPDFCSRVFWLLCSHSQFREDIVQHLVASAGDFLDFNFTDDISDRSCLHEAATSGNAMIVRICVEHGARLDGQDIYGRQPLHYAAMNGHTECLQIILTASPLPAGLNVDSIDHDGYSALLYGVIHGRLPCVSLLLEHGASVEGNSIQELSPLSLACQHGHTEIAKLLLEKEAKSVANSDGLLPLHLACREGHAKLTRLLIQHGSDIHGKDNYNGWEPLFYAASEGHEECVKVLLQAGSSADIRDESGWTPCTYALWNGHVRLASMLEVSKPEPPNAVEANGDVIDSMPPLSLDAIPDLSLPPPIIPIYGTFSIL